GWGCIGGTRYATRNGQSGSHGHCSAVFGIFILPISRCFNEPEIQAMAAVPLFFMGLRYFFYCSGHYRSAGGICTGKFRWPYVDPSIAWHAGTALVGSCDADEAALEVVARSISEKSILATEKQAISAVEQSHYCADSKYWWVVCIIPDQFV